MWTQLGITTSGGTTDNLKRPHTPLVARAKGHTLLLFSPSLRHPLLCVVLSHRVCVCLCVSVCAVASPKIGGAFVVCVCMCVCVFVCALALSLLRQGLDPVPPRANKNWTEEAEKRHPAWACEWQGWHTDTHTRIMGTGKENKAAKRKNGTQTLGSRSSSRVLFCAACSVDWLAVMIRFYWICFFHVYVCIKSPVVYSFTCELLSVLRAHTEMEVKCIE